MKVLVLCGPESSGKSWLSGVIQAHFGGVVVTESVFNIPGLGRLVLESVLARDYTVIQTVILLFSTIYVFINLAVDLLYGLFDPRIRY